MFKGAKKDSLAILQLNESLETEFLRFESLRSLKTRGIKPKQSLYRVVYVMPQEACDNLIEMLEGVFTKFNIDRPEDFTGHSLSVSDVIAVKKNNCITYYYVDSVGFKQLDWA